MYLAKPGTKRDPVKRWNQPDRVFFACGACHILAWAFLQKYPTAGFSPLWIKPADGFTGNHIFLTRDDGLAFDYHGYSRRDRLLAHTHEKANRWWPGWHAETVPLPPGVLVSEARSRTYDGLWLREPGQFLHNALPRAEAYLARFPAPPPPYLPLRSAMPKGCESSGRPLSQS